MTQPASKDRISFGVTQYSGNYALLYQYSAELAEHAVNFEADVKVMVPTRSIH